MSVIKLKIKSSWAEAADNVNKDVGQWASEQLDYCVEKENNNPYRTKLKVIKPEVPKKVLCQDCRFYDTSISSIGYSDCMFNPVVGKQRFSGITQIRNTFNDCQYYKKIWWKFWV